MKRRPLGASGLSVSILSLGSWRTYERISREAGIAVMSRARELGINFLDDARYDDESGHAPMKTGYSEVVFGELFRSSGWKREEVVLANKLWWEFWPQESAAAEVEASLRRMGMDHIDLVYAAEPPDRLPVDQVVEAMARLIEAGKVLAWGVLNWPPALIARAAEIARLLGAPAPCAAQLAYNVVMRSPVEDHEMAAVLERADVAVVASYTLHGGALTGKYVRPDEEGRVTAGLDKRDYTRPLAAAEALTKIAVEHGTTASALAIAFALKNPHVASVLFGATSPAQVDENAKALELVGAAGADWMERVRAIGFGVAGY